MLMVYYGTLHCPVDGTEYERSVLPGERTYTCPTCGTSIDYDISLESDVCTFDCPICNKTELADFSFVYYTIGRMCVFIEARNSMYAAAVF